MSDALLWLLPKVPDLVAGVLDEPAHAATAVILLAALALQVDRGFLLWALVGSMVLDLDHLPGMLGWDVLDQASTRPYPHTLLAPVLALAAAAVCHGRRCRAAALGLACGLVAHLARDVAEPQEGQPGVALLSPAWGKSFVVPYAWYGVTMAVLMLVALFRRR